MRKDCQSEVVQLYKWGFLAGFLFYQKAKVYKFHLLKKISVSVGRIEIN